MATFSEIMSTSVVKCECEEEEACLVMIALTSNIVRHQLVRQSVSKADINFMNKHQPFYIHLSSWSKLSHKTLTILHSDRSQYRADNNLAVVRQLTWGGLSYLATPKKNLRITYLRVQTG